jgi:sugar phosphate isomerase/epimerase
MLAASAVTAISQTAVATQPPANASTSGKPFRLRYLLGSCMFGMTKLEDVLANAKKTNATAVDLWPKPHGNQREQLDQLGEAVFAELLEKHDVQLGCITQYGLGPFGLQKEMRLANRLGCKTLVTGGRGPANLKGQELKTAVGKFVEQMKPHLEVAEANDVTIAIENHGHNLINSPDSLKWLVELCPSKRLAVALAPYHLPQDTKLMSQLIRELGNRIAVFYAWQHGMGCMKKLPKEQELLQLPGRGELDFVPLLEALQAIDYQGWTEIFMHPVPRGIPILDSTSAVVDEINRSRDYLEKSLPLATPKKPH